MSVYVDTSALVKLFASEEHSDAVRTVFDAADGVVTSHLTFVEAHAAFARMRTGGRLSGPTYDRLAADFDELWADLVVVAISDRVVIRGAALARRHGLRGYDAMQLACALELSVRSPAWFVSFDAELEVAAAREGMQLLVRE